MAIVFLSHQHHHHHRDNRFFRSSAPESIRHSCDPLASRKCAIQRNLRLELEISDIKRGQNLEAEAEADAGL